MTSTFHVFCAIYQCLLLVHSVVIHIIICTAVKVLFVLVYLRFIWVYIN